MADGKIFSDKPEEGILSRGMEFLNGGKSKFQTWTGTAGYDNFNIENGGSNITINDAVGGGSSLFIGGSSEYPVPNNIDAYFGSGEDKAEIYAVNGANIKQAAGDDLAVMGTTSDPDGWGSISNVKLDQGAGSDTLEIKNNSATNNTFNGGKEKDGSAGNDRVLFNVPRSRHEILKADSDGVRIRDKETLAENTYGGYEGYEYRDGTKLTLAQIREQFAQSGTSLVETSQTPTAPLTTAGLAPSAGKAPGE